MSEDLPELFELAPAPGLPEPREKMRRENPCIKAYGAGPAGTTCRRCRHLLRWNRAKTYIKCGLRNNSHGAGTDHPRRLAGVRTLRGGQMTRWAVIAICLMPTICAAWALVRRRRRDAMAEARRVARMD